MTIKTAVTPLTIRRDLLLFASSSLVLAACGGGSDSRTINLDYTKKAWFEGKLIDAAGAAISGATVYIPYANDVYSTTTDGDGKYNLQVAISDFSGLSQWIIKFFKDGFAPKFLSYDGPITGATTYGLRVEEGRLAKLLANEYSSLTYARLLHIGDDSFGGSANSQLQVAAVGTFASSAVFPWDASMNGKFKTAVVTLQMRGLQGISSKGGFLALVSSGNAIIGASYSLDFNTDANGGYNEIKFTVVLPASIPAGPISVYAQSGGNGSGDRDDLEYTGISVRLVP